MSAVPFYVAIPARSAARRLPGKPLLELGGRPMLQWVYEHACASGAAAVAVAAGDAAVAACARGFGAPVWETRADHPNGTARVAELLERAGWAADAVVVNVQGDEPLLPPALIAAAAAGLAARPAAFAATLSAPLGPGDWERPQAVKVWTGADGCAQGFARRDPGVPAARCRRHIGVYAYRAAGLRAYAALPPSPRETAESLEQWRLLENGLPLHVTEVREAPPAGIDTPEDLARTRRLLAEAAA